MPVNFSTIRPMDPATISRRPSYCVEDAAPAASTPISQESKKKSSHWFLKTIIGAVVIAGAAALATKHVDALKNIVKPEKLAEGAKVMDQVKYYGNQALYYGKKGIAAVGNFVLEYGQKAVNYVKDLFPKAAEGAAAVAEGAAETAGKV